MSLTPGVICMFTGGTIPDGWLLCDGKNNTPNLIDRFILGASSADTNIISETGISGSHPKKYFTNTTNGSLITASVTIAPHTLTIAEVPSHTHKIVDYEGDYLRNADGGSRSGSDRYPVSTGTKQPDLTTTSVGGGGSHSHNGSLTNQSSHSHGININMPYYTLAFIMYVGV